MYRAGGKRKKAKNGGSYPGQGRWPDVETLAGKGSGYKPPTAALWKVLVGGVCVSRQVAVLGGGVEGAGKGCRFWWDFSERRGCKRC